MERIPIPSALPVERHCHHRVTSGLTAAPGIPPLAGAELPHGSVDGSNETLQVTPSELYYSLWKKLPAAQITYRKSKPSERTWSTLCPAPAELQMRDQSLLPPTPLCTAHS